LNDVSSQPGLKKNWSLTAEAFAHLLAWLDAGSDSDGERYLSMRSTIVTYFDRKNCLNPDDLADEVLNRVGRRLEEEGDIKTESPAKYCYTVARFVFMEQLRSASAKEVPIEETDIPSGVVDEAAAFDREIMMECLDECSGKLDSAQREMIIGYYTGEKGTKIANRRRLAEELGVSLNALGIRAFRIREKLEACVTKCLAARERK
jgi:DNA-directed RNA polymerase specialized sigma24 family protein